jgi:hypothetical protein
VQKKKVGMGKQGMGGHLNSDRPPHLSKKYYLSKAAIRTQRTLNQWIGKKCFTKFLSGMTTNLKKIKSFMMISCEDKTGNSYSLIIRYIKREQEYRRHIDELQRELRIRCGYETDAAEKNYRIIRTLKEQLLDNIEDI